MEIALAEGSPAAFGAATVCEAFQTTVAARRDRVALRTKGNGIAWTWGEYGDRVEQYAGGFAGLGVQPHEAVAILLVNRPEMNAVDMGAVHLGAVPFSIYATSTVERTAVDAAIAKANDQLSRVEQIKRYVLLPEEWLPAGDELTPTMKLRRKPIAAKYADRIAALYA